MGSRRVLAVLALLGAAAAVPVYVMLPLDLINLDGSVNDIGQLQSDLGALAGAGVKGVMSDVWWGIAERAGPKAYNFSGYEQVIEVVAAAHLEFQAVMSFHQCGGNVGDACDIPLPGWVTGATGEDVWYEDAEGNKDMEYISLWADNKALFAGRTPIQMYSDYMSAFKSAMSTWISQGVVSQIQVSCGPSGELRYPAYPSSRWSFCGVGEFQCYGSLALADLAAAAAAAGHPEYGHAGPDNAGTYNNIPSQTGFFGSGTNNYASSYGQFFLGWYSNALISHGQRVMSAAASVFGSLPIAAKVAGVHWWYKDSSHAAELTAGYYNTNGNDAYTAIAKMLAGVGAEFDFTCLEMQDGEQPSSCDCGPYELVQETKAAASAVGIGFGGENALARYDQTAYSTIESQSHSIAEFTYLRLGPTLMQGGNFQAFEAFVGAMAKI